jgi:glycosyltransferase involved in cell wall biosynthesis
VLTSARRHAINFPDHPRLELHVHELPRWTKAVRSIARVVQRRRFRRLQRAMPADVLHPTYYGLLSQTAWDACGLPVVLTVHDLIHERFRTELDPQGETAERKRQAVAAADAIICVSQHTKADLLEIYAPPAEKISVIPHASDLQPSDLAPPPTNGPPYFLYVGSRATYKNFARLLDALQAIAGRHADVELQVVGPPFQAGERTRIEQLGLQHRIRHCGHVADRELVPLYRGSVAFVYPSLYEGFGIPVLEAMSCGCVVVASNRTSIPEVVGGAGLLFDPSSTEALAACLADLLESPARRQALIDQGFRRAQQFSWERTAEQTVAVYRAVAGHRASHAA